LLFLLAALARLAALLYFPYPEPNYYWTLSDNIVTNQQFAFEGGPTTYIEPLYPAFLAGARLVSGDVLWLVLLLQIAVASAGAVLVYQICRSMGGSPRAATIGALFYALDPYFVRQSVSFIEVPFLVTLLLWTLQQVLAATAVDVAAPTAARSVPRSRQVLVGALLGALVLTRASLGPLVAMAIALLAWRRGWRSALLAAATTALVVSPWIVRSYRLDGSLLPSRLGENLFASTSEYAIGFLPEHDIDLLMPLAYEIVDRELGDVPPSELPVATDRLLRDRALQFARSHPRETLALKARNVLYLFWPGLLPVEAKSDETSVVFENSRVRIVGAEPRPRSWEWLHFTVRALLLVSAVAGLFIRRRRWREDAILYAVILTVAVVHVVFFPTTRLLAPMTAILMIYAGWGYTGQSKSLVASR
jgi:4-amino-4-deoxy-L-arabinose transferase-like glycosyltransferase